MSDDSGAIEWKWERCPAWSLLNKVQCQREKGHARAHIHDYGNGHITGWENADE